MKRFTPPPRKKSGFTLAELLIVVAIIAVLIAIALPVFSNQLESSRDAVDQANERSAASVAVSTYLMYEGSGPVTFTIGMDGKENLGINAVSPALTGFAPSGFSDLEYGKGAVEPDNKKKHLEITVNDGKVTASGWKGGSGSGNNGSDGEQGNSQTGGQETP